MSRTLLNEFVGLSAAATIAPLDVATITPRDALIVVDMQHDFLPGGSFGVAEGDAATTQVVRYIKSFADAGALVVATRDYHPIDHCSFNSHGGPFPAHCVQGSRGAQLVEEVAAAMQPLVAADKGAVVFKGFSRGVDSFGAFRYGEAQAEGRVSTDKSCPHCELSWTGAFVLFSSLARSDVNAPPDVMAVLDRVSLQDYFRAKNITGRVFVVGLALDFCVLDTAQNASVAGHSTVILTDATRAAHIPGIGAHGSGFLTDPKAFAAKCATHNIQLTSA